jgi:pimeloyl-ACP methyl ester carboxylesterase
VGVRAVSVLGPRGPLGWSEEGAGPPLILVAGLGATRTIWGDLPHLLARRFTVLAVDNRGVGASRGGAPFTLEGAAADVVLALDEGGHDRAHLLGASMGGLVALVTALSAPERVSRLVAISCAAHLSPHGRRQLALMRDLLHYLPPGRVGEALMTLAFAPCAHARMPGLVSQAAALYGLQPEDVVGAQAQADHLLAGWDIRPRLAHLEVPTLVLAGSRDPVVAPEDTAELARTIPGAELVEVPGAAHSLLAEGGRELLDRVVDFLA